MSEEHRCNKCDEKLILNENWTKASMGRYDYTCNTCQNKLRQNWEKTLKGRYIIYQRNAKKRSLSFNLSFFEFINMCIKPCAYCGIKQLYNGVDRVNNEIGYNIKNCSPCCTTCNRMKRCMSVEEFRTHCRSVVNYGN